MKRRRTERGVGGFGGETVRHREYEGERERKREGKGQRKREVSMVDVSSKGPSRREEGENNRVCVHPSVPITTTTAIVTM